MWGEVATLSEHVDRLHSVFVDSLYLSVVTMTTVAYGDLAPASGAAKASTALQGIVGIGFIGVALGHYFAVCLSCRDEG